MDTNVGATDRVVRIVAGILLVGVAVLGFANVAAIGSVPAAAALVVGGVLVVTAVARRCPAYRLLGVSSGR